MPAKNCLKEYEVNSYYHVYNRGVAKAPIFLDKQDYKVFLSYLKFYLMPIVLQRQSLKVAPSRILKNFAEELKLLAYCLMPNHFHLFIFQKETDSMANFMRSVGTKYSKYFNKKYHRVGPVFQSRYKAVYINRENQFIYLSKYIHRNPLALKTCLEDYPFSSYPNYLGITHQPWVDTQIILSYFSETNAGESYKTFIEEQDERDILTIKNLVLDYDIN